MGVTWPTGEFKGTGLTQKQIMRKGGKLLEKVEPTATMFWVTNSKAKYGPEGSVVLKVLLWFKDKTYEGGDYFFVVKNKCVELYRKGNRKEAI